MLAPLRMFRPSLGLMVILVLAVIFVLQPATALGVTNPKIMADVTPGQTFQWPMNVSISSKESASDYAIDVEGFGMSSQGDYTPLTAIEDTGPYSARSFVTVDLPLVHLEPGQVITVKATVTVPQNVGEGGKYALINIHQAKGAGMGASFGAAIIVPVMLTVKGTTLIHTGSITNLQAGNVGTDKPIQIQTTLKNTGNHHYYGYLVNVTVTDSGGKTVATGSTTPILALIPGGEVTLRTPITAALTPGTYTVKSDAKLADGMVLLDTKTATFTIQAPYVPPTPQASPQATVAGATPIPSYTVPAPAGTTGPNKIPFLPIYTPGPDALITVGVLSAALLLWSGRRRK